MRKYKIVEHYYQEKLWVMDIETKEKFIVDFSLGDDQILIPHGQSEEWFKTLVGHEVEFGRLRPFFYTTDEIKLPDHIERRLNQLLNPVQ